MNLPQALTAANALQKQGQFDEAIQCYRALLSHYPDAIDVYYNLGLALIKQGDFDAARDNYSQLLNLAPDHFAARFHLACTWMRQNKWDQAIQEFLIIETECNHFETETNLATCYLKQGELALAKSHYLKALELAPEDTQILFNLGVICMQQGFVDSAIRYYQKAVQIQPDHYPAHNNLGVAFLAKQHLAFALCHFKEALRLQPQNEALAYTVKMLTQNQSERSAPSGYIQSLFDAYADHYEPHLLTALDYQIPTLLLDAIKSTLHPQKIAWDILDLGCGTGLCGVHFKPFAKSLTGVDLSPKMLAVATEKQIYDALHTNDLTTFLSQQHKAYDLILAGDVLVYLGDLKNLFSSIHQALRTDGYFAFNTEIEEAAENSEYKMNQSGRFAHQKNYIDQIAVENQLKIIYYQCVVTRMQNGEPVYGHLYILQSKENR